MKYFSILIPICLLCLLSACSVQNEDVCMKVRKLMPFSVSNLTQQGQKVFRFECDAAPDYAPDYYMRQDKSIWGAHTYYDQIKKYQTEDEVWRNLKIDKRHKRILCIDRVIKNGKITGCVYILESEQKKHIVDENCTWNVTDPRNMELVGSLLDDWWKQTWQKVYGVGLQPPLSQHDYWRLIFHTDSINDPAALKEYYDAAFTEDKYIFTQHLTKAAQRMLELGDTQAYRDYIEHRIRMEGDYYEEEPDYILPKAYTDKYKERQQKYHYDLKLKKELEDILEKDQHNRTQWWLALNDNPRDSLRNNALGKRAWETDHENLVRVEEILSKDGFPSKTKVGKDACEAVFIVIQHADIDTQTKYLTTIEKAAKEGNVPMKYVAMLRDRIDVREGRPQKYGTQSGPDSKLCPLLDKSKVNEWRREVGLPPLSF